MTDDERPRRTHGTSVNAPMSEESRRELRLAAARVDQFISRAANLLQRAEADGRIPESEAFHQAELESLDRSLEILITKIFCGPVPEDTWMSPGAFAWRHGLPTSDRFAWLKALHVGLRSAKDFLEALLRAEDAHDTTRTPADALTREIPSTVRPSRRHHATSPMVFISYSHDSPAHKEWVRRLAERLIAGGVDVKLDVWDAGLGTDLARFMEDGVNASDRVLMVCTENYVQRVNGRKGGAGYEATIVSGALIQNLGTDKFVPIIRQSESPRRLPSSLSSRLYIDFSSDSDFESALEELLRELHDLPMHPKPPLGDNPFRTEGAFPAGTDTALTSRPPRTAPHSGIGNGRDMRDQRDGIAQSDAISPNQNRTASLPSTADRTTFERWKHRLLDNPLVAATALFAISAGGLVGIKEGYTKIFSPAHPTLHSTQSDVSDEIGFRTKQVDTILQEAERLQAKCLSEQQESGTISGSCVRDYLNAAQVLSVTFQLGGIFSPPGKDDDTIWIGSSGFGMRHLPSRRSYKFSAYSELDMKDLLKRARSEASTQTATATSLLDEIERLSTFSETEVLADWFKRHQAQGPYRAIYGEAYKVYESRLDDYAEEVTAVETWLNRLAAAWRQFEAAAR